MNDHRILTTASDCIARFRSSQFPLKNVAKEMSSARKLNSRERKLFLDVVFRFSREIHLIDQYFHETIKFIATMSRQQRDALALKLLINDDDSQRDYRQWKTSLGDEQFLLSLGPLISEHLKSDYGDDAQMIARGLTNRARQYLAFDRRHLSKSDICSTLSQHGIEYFSHPMHELAIGIKKNIDVTSLPFGDHVWVMDAGSQIVSELISPTDNDRVLDLCVGEGGKARFITTKSSCDYVALDIDEARLKRAEKRLHKERVAFICADGKNPPLKKDSFDWILLDAPCTGIGVLRRHPDLIHRLSVDALKKYQTLQRELLRSAVNLLKPSGILVYATCSLNKCENEQQIAQIFAENKQLKPVQLRHLVGDFVKLGDDAVSNNSFTLYPHIHDCDGFYFAALTK